MALAKGRYEIGMAQDAGHVREAQRLRWLCFVGARRGESDPESLDADDYDQRCRHVLIRETASGRLVACFRMLTLSGGAEIGESYSARFYNLSRLAGYGGRMAEIGRFCIHPEWGDPDILRLAWAALALWLGHAQARRAAAARGTPSLSPVPPAHASRMPGPSPRDGP